MARLIFRRAVGVLWAALATGCLGGQTGQPSSIDCGAAHLSPSAAWSTTTVRAAARAFEGTYSAGLQWRAEPRSATATTVIDLQDGVELVIAYEDAQGWDCIGQLNVPVSVTLTTSASGVSETGVGTLSIQRSSQGLIGSLHAETETLKLDATLREAAAGLAPQGSFDALDPKLPGASAIFIEVP